MSYRIPIDNQSVFRPIPLQKKLRLWAHTALAPVTKAGCVAIQLVDEATSASLNHQYRAKNKPTNVLSFPLAIPVKQRVPMLGELVICPAVIWQEAVEQDKCYEAHFAHIVIHGVLHLLGYDHVQPDEAHVMESLEISLLSQLAIENPYE